VARSASDLTPKAKRTRAALIEAAQKFIGEKGIDGLNVMEACEAAGVGRTSFYNYFEDANTLTRTVAEAAAQLVKNNFDVLHKHMPRGLVRLKQCLTMILNIAADDPETALLLTALAYNTPAIPDLVHREITQELSAAVKDGVLNIQRSRIDVLAHFLKLSTLAICREIALGELPKEHIDDHIRIMMGACRAVEN